MQELLAVMTSASPQKNKAEFVVANLKRKGERLALRRLGEREIGAKRQLSCRCAQPEINKGGMFLGSKSRYPTEGGMVAQEGSYCRGPYLTDRRGTRDFKVLSF